MDTNTEEYLQTSNDHLTKLQCIVKKAMEDEKLIIENLMNPPKDLLSRGQKISDKVARFGGSWAFIISFFCILIVWILFNTLAPNKEDFDPYPFILMNLILSCIAALQAPVIMMSQNRKEEKDRQRSENDYLINLKAELELRSLHEKMDLLLEDQIQQLIENQVKQMEMIQSLEQKINREERPR